MRVALGCCCNCGHDRHEVGYLGSIDRAGSESAFFDRDAVAADRNIRAEKAQNVDYPLVALTCVLGDILHRHALVGQCAHAQEKRCI